MTNALVWFRSDLRTRDNPALYHAVREAAGGLVAAFIISPGQWAEHDWAGVKVDFVLRHLRELAAALRKLDIPLLVGRTERFSDQPRALLELAHAHSCSSLYFNDEYELNEARRDGAVRDLFSANGLSVRTFTDQCLVTPGEVRTGEGRPYTVFTPFRKALYAKLISRGPIKALSAPQRDKRSPQLSQSVDGDRPRDTGRTHWSPAIPGRVEGFDSKVDPSLWPAGEDAALERLNTFVSRHIGAYHERRDYPAADATSTLSPYLAVGALTARQCVAAALAANGERYDSGNPGIVSWISELAWREFYRHIVHAFPRVCMGRAFKPQTERIRWSNREDQFAAWCDGRTGVPIVDAGMRQLLRTGWMHNRVRMITAMYLTKDLFIDWRWGEKHFMRHLIDGDLASNNGGWQWSASTGTDAAPYFRIFNPITQSRKFDPAGDFIRRHVPELAMLAGGENGPIHDPSDLPPLQRAGLDYPAPLVERALVKERVLAAFQGLADR